MINVQDKNTINAILFEVNQYGLQNLMHKAFDTHLYPSPYNFVKQHMVCYNYKIMSMLSVKLLHKLVVFISNFVSEKLLLKHFFILFITFLFRNTISKNCLNKSVFRPGNFASCSERP